MSKRTETHANFAPAPTSPTDDSIKPKNWLEPDEERLIPPRDMWIGPGDSIHHYYRWIWEYLAYRTLITELHREHAVLELACGHGRTCRALLGYLRSPGRYVGLDVDRRRIEDAQQRIQNHSSIFQFMLADVHSALYNPQGTIAAANYKFPFPDESFDVVYAASLFTHLLPDETKNYLSETRRVLKPKGRALFSFFVLDYYHGPGTSVSPSYEFPHAWSEPGVAVRDLQHPDAIIAYSEDRLRTYADTAGLQVGRIIPGYWSESPGWAVNEQDMILFTK